MIFDDLSNLKEYNLLPPEVYVFIDKLDLHTPDGRYEINDKIYANIETYTRKNEFEATLEAHKKFIDIQFLIFGTERIDFANINGLKVLEDYDHIKDIMFFKRPRAEIGSLYLNSRNFAVFYPQDAHAPQITTMSAQNNVKKVVIKIAVEFE